MKLFFVLICLFTMHSQLGLADSMNAGHGTCESYMAQGVEALKKNNAPLLPSPAQCPVIHKTLSWLTFLQGKGKFEDIVTFLKENPSWPDRAKLQEAAEKSITAKTSQKSISNYFKKYTPLTSSGALAYAKLLAKTRPPSQLGVKIQKLWIRTNFTDTDEKEFHRLYRSHLNSETYRLRLNRLLLEGNYYALKSMKKFVSPKCQDVIDYGLKLIKRSSKFRMMWVRIPKCYKQYPGLLVQRLRWLIRKDENIEALKVFEEAIRSGVFKNKPDLIIRFRNYFSRHYVKDKKFKEAVDICDAYPVDPKKVKSKVDYTEGEWFRAWIELRYLKKEALALDRFATLYKLVRTPISRSKMCYWAGRSAESSGSHSLAKTWYKKGSQHSHTFYGQLCLGKLKKNPQITLQKKVMPVNLSHNERTLLSILKLLTTYGYMAEKEKILLYLAQGCRKELGAYLVSLTHEMNMEHLAVIVAKYAGQKKTILTEHAYPTLPLNKGILKKKHIDEVLVHALIRQESNFNTRSISTADARGLMQLRHKTAKGVSTKLGIRLNKRDLTQNPQKNVNIGTSFLSSILDRFNGNYILALAAYNAGPHRVKEWIEVFGNPDEKHIDTIDWIEMIPYGETRGYVQRITESLHIYAARLGKTSKYLNKI